MALTRSALAAGMVVASLGAVGAGAADATTFCVHPLAGQSCSGTAKPNLQSALTAAATAPNDTHRNTVIVGNPGPAPGSGYTYSTPNPATNPVDIVGAGQDKTTLTFSGGSSSTVLQLQGDGSSVSNLRLVVRRSTGGTGLVLIGASARAVRVTSPGPQSHSLIGVNVVQGSTPSAPRPAVTQSTFAFPIAGTGGQTPVLVSVGSLVADDQIAGQNTVNGGLLFASAPSGYSNTSTVRRVLVGAAPRASSDAIGILVSGATVNADNVALRVAGGTGTGFGVLVSSGSHDGTLKLNHASIYGNGDTASSPSSFGVYTAASSGKDATTRVRNSIVRNFFYATYRTANGSGSAANIRYDFSDFDFIHRIGSNSSGGTGTITNGVGNLYDVDPGWPNPVNDDFRIPAGSPVINRGDPAGLNPAVESLTDVLGQPRISNHRRDMGAVEFQFPPPRFRLLKGRFDPRNRRVRLPARCDQPAGDRCNFKLNLTGKLTRKVKGKKKHRNITLSLIGSAAGGKTATLRTKLPKGIRPFLAHRKKLRLAVAGTVTDNEAAVAAVTGHVTLKRASIKH